MRLTVRVLCLLAIAAAWPPPTLRAQADERTIYATVVDQSGGPVTGLTTGDVIVRENDMAREVLRVAPAKEPLHIALLVDTSAAIDPHMLDLRLAVRAFLKQMAGTHEIALIGFGERPTVLVDYTRDAARLDKGIGSIFPRPGSGTYLLEAIVNAADGLERREVARPHIIAITARGPEFSELHHDNVLENLRESGATLHAFALSKPGFAQTDRSEQELEMSLAEGTKMSGGRRDELLTTMALTERLLELARELNGQYAITYGRPRTLVPPKTLEVSAKNPALTVRTRRWP